MVTIMYTSMKSCIRFVLDFEKFTASEQFTLLEYNLSTITIFGFVFILSPAIINNKVKYIDLWTTIYGSDIVHQAKNIDKQLSNDLTIVKLMLVVLTFSSNCSIIDVHENMFNDSLFYDTHRFLGSQNVYVELLWKYMIYRYGYHNTVLHFSRLIDIFLNLIKYTTIAYRDNLIYHQLIDNIFDKVKQSFMTNLNNQVSLQENDDV